MSKQNITIIGGGPASLMLACSLDTNKFNISIYEKNAALGRKFLVAGKGGFNLTHSEDLSQFAERYNPKQFVQPFLEHFSNTDFRNWLKSIGVETYVGTSKRVFPIKGIKPIEVLNQFENELRRNRVSVFCHHEWNGWKDGELLFNVNNQVKTVRSDFVVFALGGASWKVTGSDGSWTNMFAEKGIRLNPFYPSNCAYQVKWDQKLVPLISGQALKNCEFACGTLSLKGEAVLTNFGIEGSGIYPLSPEIRKQLLGHTELDSASIETPTQIQANVTREKAARLNIDFKPDLSLEEIKSRLENKGKLSVKDVLEKKVNLSSSQIELLKSASSKEDYNNAEFLSRLIKVFPLEIVGFAPIDKAISTVGGIALNEINENLELKKMPRHYCIGEMLDWDAPTGGYLLQATISMGRFLADKLNKL
ncbi:MAG: TIGR03862 family flavoprotein [Bacteroidota bacterium]